LDAWSCRTCQADALQDDAAGKIKRHDPPTGPLTDGVIEVWVLYTTAAA